MIGTGVTNQIRALFSARTTFDGGIGGQITTQIIARQGSEPALVTVTSNQIPASGSVAVTGISTRLLSTPATTTVTRKIDGSLGGIPGTLTCVESAAGDSSDAYTFTRKTAGIATTISPDTPFVIDTAGHDSWVNVIWMGRNNSYKPDEVKTDIAKAVAFLKTNPKQFVVLGITNAASEPVGSSQYTTITKLNQDLAATYPNNFIDIRAYLVSQYDPTNAQDITDHANDVVPTSLRRDPLHLNAKGDQVVAKKVAEFIQAKGW